MNSFTKETIPDEVNKATYIYHTAINEFKEKADSLSNKESRRLLKLLVEFPLHDEKQRVSVNLQNLFGVIEKCISAKNVLLQYAEETRLKKMENEKNDSESKKEDSAVRLSEPKEEEKSQ